MLTECLPPLQNFLK